MRYHSEEPFLSRRLIAALFALILVVLLTGCSDESAQGATSDPPARRAGRG